MGLLENAISEELSPHHSIPPAPPALPQRKVNPRVQEKNKVIAAAVGATLTSLTMTPFDVIKTRLQTQAPPEPLFVPSSHLPPPSSSSSSRSSTSPWPPPIPSTSTAPPPPPPTSIVPASSSTTRAGSTSKAATNLATCCQKTYFTTNVADSLLCRFDPRVSTSSLPASGTHIPRSTPSASLHLLAPLPSSTITTTTTTTTPCVYPTSTIATLSLPTSSLPSSSRHLTGFWDAVTKIIRYEGVSSLWRGTAPALAMSVPGQVVYMVGYDWGRRTAFSHPPSWALTPSAELTPFYLTLVPLLAGSLSRTLVAALTSPLELIRTRLQASSTSSVTIPSIIRALRNEPGGLASAWRGLPPTLWRDVPFSGIYWAGYEGIKRSLTGGKGMGEGWEDQGAWGEFGVAFVSGAGSGMLAATLTNPFDVVKTRRQAFDSTAPVATMKDGKPAAPELTKTFPILFDIAKKEGWAGLMRGLTPRLAKVGPACGLMIGAYEGLGRILD